MRPSGGGEMTHSHYVVRSILMIGGLLMLVLSYGYYTQADWAIATWLWPEQGRLTYVFMASMQAAIAVAMLWIGFSGDVSVMAAGGLNLFLMMAGIAVFLLMDVGTSEPRAVPYGIACAVFALCNLPLILWARRFPVQQAQPTPMGVRISFVIFIVALIGVGLALVLQLANIFPWPLRPDTATIFGWMFLGDSLYFLYGLLLPRWSNARAQLWSFLAYDLVLIGPFINHFANVTPERLPSLIVYTGVLVLSGVIALYYLLINPTSRVWRQRSPVGRMNSVSAPLLRR